MHDGWKSSCNSTKWPSSSFCNPLPAASSKPSHKAPPKNKRWREIARQRQAENENWAACFIWTAPCPPNTATPTLGQPPHEVRPLHRSFTLHTCTTRGARAPLTVHLPSDERRDTPARVGVIDDHGTNGSLLMLAGAIYKHKHRLHFFQLWCILAFLFQTLLEGPAHRLKCLFLFGRALSHADMVMEPCLLRCCLIMLLVNTLRSSDPGDGCALSREMKK